MEKEIWKDIKCYEGKYQVSNLSNIKSLNYNNTGKEKILSQFTTKRGYKRVMLYRNGKPKPFLVHRLVAEAFLVNDDPVNKTQINHKDENPNNNKVENLEYCTVKYNNNYGNHKKRLSESQKGRTFTEEHKRKLSENHADFTGTKNPRTKKVQCLNNGMIFDTVTEAAKWSSTHRNCIAKQIKGNQKTAGKNPVTGEKLMWKYID